MGLNNDYSSEPEIYSLSDITLKSYIRNLMLATKQILIETIDFTFQLLQPDYKGASSSLVVVFRWSVTVCIDALDRSWK